MQQQENCSVWQQPVVVHDQAATADGRREPEENGCPAMTAGGGEGRAEVAASAAGGVNAAGSPERSAAHVQALAPVLGASLCSVWYNCWRLPLSCVSPCMSLTWPSAAMQASYRRTRGRRRCTTWSGGRPASQAAPLRLALCLRRSAEVAPVFEVHSLLSDCDADRQRLGAHDPPGSRHTHAQL